MRWLKFLLYFIIVLVFIYFLGPSPKKPKYALDMPAVPVLDSLANYIANNEAAHKIKPDNQARIIWANDSPNHKTDYAIVYLHGFSASQEEGDPVHKQIAKKFGCNLYLSRLAEHGIDTTDQLINLTPENYWESAKQALAIGKQLGKKVILMGTSTGGTQALQLAAAYPKDVAALVLYSPNIALFDSRSWLLTKHWGLQIARMVKGSKFNIIESNDPVYKQYWNTNYRLEAVVNLEEMLETSMTKETFNKIKQPTLMLYYYKDDIHQDSVVCVSASKQMFKELGTDSTQKLSVAMPNTGNHVLASPIKSRDVEGVERETDFFLEKIVHLNQIK